MSFDRIHEGCVQVLPDPRFTNQPLSFWAYIRAISQRLGYYSDERGHDDQKPASSTGTEIEDEISRVFPVEDVIECLTAVRTKLTVNFRYSGKFERLSFDPDTRMMRLTGELSETQIAKLCTDDKRKGWEDALKRLRELSIATPNLDVSDLLKDGALTELGELLVDYLNFRNRRLVSIEPQLMTRDKAREVFESLKSSLNPTCHLPNNKQRKDKQHPAYLTGIVNMLTEKTLGGRQFDDNPKSLTTMMKDQKLFRTFSRRIDGAFPSTRDPAAVWEVKEYYGTTTFGSRVADGVYETMLDGFELRESEESHRKINHYLIVDDHYTWWVKGKSYLCRLVDILHMGLVDEVLFGQEVLERWPVVSKSWVSTRRGRK